MSKPHFRELVAGFTRGLVDRPLDDELGRWLNAHHGAGSAFNAFRQACLEGVAGGWMCEREGGGIRHGRVFPASDDLHRFSVDVVDMPELLPNALAGQWQQGPGAGNGRTGDRP